MLQDRCDTANIGFHLDRVREIMGEGAYVKQLFYPITTATNGPASCWITFVNGCYDRNLIPIVRLAGPYGGAFWLKPTADAPGDYTSIAQAFARVVSGLPRRDGRTLYVEIWNEPEPGYRMERRRQPGRVRPSARRFCRRHPRPGGSAHPRPQWRPFAKAATTTTWPISTPWPQCLAPCKPLMSGQPTLTQAITHPNTTSTTVQRRSIPN